MTTPNVRNLHKVYRYACNNMRHYEDRAESINLSEVLDKAIAILTKSNDRHVSVDVHREEIWMDEAGNEFEIIPNEGGAQIGCKMVCKKLAEMNIESHSQ